MRRKRKEPQNSYRFNGLEKKHMLKKNICLINVYFSYTFTSILKPKYYER